ncbi:unnamed protein product [Euphydryas editha]|uniref:Uncharacterized protein n=1 Tax=Euphydryas editha TaxID=104508 RepID=A0AAU9TG31_EUPED|nr:unnamed protein product [Euphydryas editha]
MCTPCVSECADKIIQKEISDTGIISLSPVCKFYTAFVTLNAEKNTKSNLMYPSHNPITTGNLEDSYIPDLFKATPTELLPITIKNVLLEALNVIKDQILGVQHRVLKEQQQKFKNNIISTFSFTSFIFETIMLLFLLYKFCPWIRIQTLRLYWNDNNDDQPRRTQIFNNCFDNSRRRQNIEISTTSILTTSCI